MTAFRDSPWSAVLVMLLGVMATLAIPKWVDDFALIQITIYVVMAILAISHQAVVLDQGRVIHQGRASDLQSQPALIERLLGVSEHKA